VDARCRDVVFIALDLSKQASKSFVVVFVSRVVRSILRSDSAFLKQQEGERARQMIVATCGARGLLTQFHINICIFTRATLC